MRGLSLEALLIVLLAAPARMSSKEKLIVPVEAVLNPIFPIFKLAPAAPVRGDPEAEGVTSTPPR